MDQTPEYTVYVSDHARQMLASHIQFLAQVSPVTARQTKNELVPAMNMLGSLAERHPFLDAEFIPPNKYHKMRVEKWYLVLYQVRDQMVFIDYVLDCRQDYQWLVR